MKPQNRIPVSSREGGGSEWLAVWTFIAANALFGSGLFFHAFLYNFYLQGLGHDESVMGMATAAISLGGLAGVVPAGVAVDRLGAGWTYILTTFVAAVGLAAGAIAEAPMAIYGAALLAGGGAAGLRVVMGPALMRLAGPAVRARAFSWNTGVLVASGAGWTAAAGLSSGWFAALMGSDGVIGHRGALLLGAALTLTAAWMGPMAMRMAGTWGEPSSAGPVRLGAGLRALAIPRSLVFILLAFGLFWIAGALLLPFFNIYFQRVHDISIERIGFILSLGQIGTAAAVFLSGEGAARRGPKTMMLTWMLMFPPTLFALAFVDRLGMAVAFYMIQAFALPAVYPLVDQILLERAPPERHGAVSSYRNLVVEGSGLLGATVGGGLLSAFSFPILFILAGTVGLAGGVMGVLLARTGSRGTRRGTSRGS